MNAVVFVVQNYLFASEVGVSEGRCKVDNGPGLEAIGKLTCGDHSLEIGKSRGKKRGVFRCNEHCRITKILTASCHKRHDDQVLGTQPLRSLFSAGRNLRRTYPDISPYRWDDRLQP